MLKQKYFNMIKYLNLRTKTFNPELKKRIFNKFIKKKNLKIFVFNKFIKSKIKKKKLSFELNKQSYNLLKKKIINI